MDTTKVTVNLPTQTVDALKNIAANRGTNVTEALRQVIESQAFLDTEVQSGNRVLIQNPADNNVRQVLFVNPRTATK
jgi:hypothetical protein